MDRTAAVPAPPRRDPGEQIRTRASAPLGRSAATVGAAAVLAVGSATASGATGTPIISNTHLVDHGSHIEQEAHGPEWCPNVPFLVSWTGRVNLHETARTRGLDGAWYSSGGFLFANTFTNVENGPSIADQGSFTFSDQRIVDNGDGTITITARDRLSYRVLGSDGRQIGREAGLVTLTVVIKTMGTPEPDDDVLVSESVEQLA